MKHKQQTQHKVQFTLCSGFQQNAQVILQYRYCRSTLVAIKTDQEGMTKIALQYKDEWYYTVDISSISTVSWFDGDFLEPSCWQHGLEI
jgi:hypothetical protein